MSTAVASSAVHNNSMSSASPSLNPKTLGSSTSFGATAATTSSGLWDERMVAQAALEAAEDQLQSLCASHAGTFVSVERRGRALEGALQELCQSLQQAQDAASSAQAALQQDEEGQEDETTLASLSEGHRVRRRTLLQHSSLLELLELPGLMDACVRSALYEEALQIAAFGQTLSRQQQQPPHGRSNSANTHTTKSPNRVIQHVVQQIASRQEDLHHTLVRQLQSAVPLPVCLEVVTALRRLNAISQDSKASSSSSAAAAVSGGQQEQDAHAIAEWKLQVDFLEARNVWLDQPTTASGGPAGAAAVEDLLDTIERYRTRVFEIATQFNAIFRAQSNPGDTRLLSTWMTRRIHTFLQILQSHPMQDAAEIRDALEAAVFFAVSLGRLGADFSGHLPALFGQKMVALVTQTWKEGLQQLEETLRVCMQAGVAGPLVKTQVPVPTSSTSDAEGTATTTPPRWLLQVPPLARLVNSFLTGLNQVRRCLLPTFIPQLRSCYSEWTVSVQGLLKGKQQSRPDLRQAVATLELVWTVTVQPFTEASLEAAVFGWESERAAALYATVQNPFEIKPEEEEQPQEGGDDNDEAKEGDEEEQKEGDAEQGAEATGAEVEAEASPDDHAEDAPIETLPS